MKILILGFTKMKFMPYINFYLSNIDTEKNDVHVVYWNRDLLSEDLSKYSDLTLHEFAYYQEDDVAKATKIKSFMKYRNFAKNVMSKTKFDKIIVLHTLPGVVLFDKLKKYKDNYILDYRDSTYEYFEPFKKIVGKLVEWSKVTFVSSDAFRKYLPDSQKNKIYTIHNILNDSLQHTEDKEKYGINSDKIRIAFWGFIRHEEINKQIISSVAKDSRFELHYYGREQQVAINLKAFVNELNAENVFFHGEYKPEERYEFVKNTDCIHNLYYDNNTLLAMGNKYYDGIIFRIPQVCMPGSFMGKMCDEYNVGVSLDPYSATFLNELYDYISNINKARFYEDCKKELDRVLDEQNVAVSILKTLFPYK